MPDGYNQNLVFDWLIVDNSIQNIDIFNASAALILGELYKNIPVPIALNYQYLSSRLFKDDAIPQEKIIEVFINTVTWLKKSGFIWLDAEGEIDVDQFRKNKYKINKKVYNILPWMHITRVTS